MTEKKKRPKRPPRQVWLVVGVDAHWASAHYATKADATAVCARFTKSDPTAGWRVVGPYILAERVRET